MSSKVKRIPKWMKCYKCSSIFHQDDKTIHEETSCPTISCNFDCTYGYVRENEFYCFVKEFEPPPSELDPSFFDNVVQVSLSVIQLGSFVIGSQVIISAANRCSVVKKLWPLQDNTLSSIFITKTSMKELGYFEGPIYLTNLKHGALPAKSIAIQLIHPETLEEDLKCKLLSTANFNLCGRLVGTSHNICFWFGGFMPILKVMRVIPYRRSNSEVEQLSETLSVTSLTEKEEHNFFVLTQHTVWEFFDPEYKTKCGSNLLTSLGGMKNVIADLRNIIETSIKSEMAVNAIKTHGVLLHGISGTGKTQLMKALAYDAAVNVVEILSWEVFSKYYGEAESQLKVLFKSASRNAPSIILIDELDSFCCDKNRTDQEYRVMTSLLMMMDRIENERVIVFATTRELESIDIAFRRPGRFDYEIEIEVPNSEARVDILRCLLMEQKHSLTDEDIKLIGSMAHGFVGSDLSLLCRQAATKAVTAGADQIMVEHINWAFSVVKPSAMREIMVEVPDVRWSDIGGEEDLKLKLRQVLEWPLKHPDALARLGLKPPRGVLLFGPPGCSKTMIAKAIATETGLNFISVKGAEVFNKWVGESEKAVRQIFRRARVVSPSVIFFDEIDAIAGERSGNDENGGSSSVQERVLSQLLIEMDGIQPLTGVTVIAATNRPDRIDSALLRPGRLDRKLYVPLPNISTREAILIQHCTKMPISSDINVTEIAEQTEGYSGAEVVAVCHEAAMKALEESLDTKCVNNAHFSYALKEVKPKTPVHLLKIYDDFINR